MPTFFISYRESDSDGKHLAHALYRELKRRYGENAAFLDVDKRKPGMPFPQKVENALKKSDVMLAVIGPEWLRILQDREKEERDWVRLEIAQGLARKNYPVVPVLCPGVRVPTRSQLPPDLEDLHWRDGVTIDPFDLFDEHLDRALRGIEDVLAEIEEKVKREVVVNAGREIRGKLGGRELTLLKALSLEGDLKPHRDTHSEYRALRERRLIQSKGDIGKGATVSITVLGQSVAEAVSEDDILRAISPKHQCLLRAAIAEGTVIPHRETHSDYRCLRSLRLVISKGDIGAGGSIEPSKLARWLFEEKDANATTRSGRVSGSDLPDWQLMALSEPKFFGKPIDEVKIPADFLEWEEGTIAVWVKVTDDLMDARDNRYILAHTFDARRQDQPDAFCLFACKKDNAWKLAVHHRSNQAKALRITFDPSIKEAWRLFAVRWKRPQVELSIDCGIYTGRTLVAEENWPHHDPEVLLRVGAYPGSPRQAGYEGSEVRTELQGVRLSRQWVDDSELGKLPRP